jgi:protein-disulfide isomerase
METEEPKKTLINVSASHVALVIAILALVISTFNTYQLKNSRVVAGAEPQGEAPEKILKELPENAVVLGNPEAELAIVEFADYQCPFCGRFFKEVYPTLKTKYIDTGKVKFIYLDFAFLGPESRDAARAAKCASEQNKFWEYHDELYNNQNGENQGAFSPANLRKFAGAVSLNQEAFDSCMADTRYDKAIEDETTLGRKYGVAGTPSFLIGRQLIRGAVPLSQLEAVIESELK